ncbi:manganese efflux pump [Aneurinibacillus terranovensis]|uniref:manganese efflux pump n=1 Tax=Aneurinibacillus terranovensis TaxID=278991 RepID=UPI00040DF477|nr:manganese efflux pump [Aneurinibacillus terranovensis]
MHWITVLFIGIAANLDNLGIGVSFGIRSTRIPLLSNFLIAFISMLGSYILLVIGHLISASVSLSGANLIGGFIIIAVGGWSIWSSRSVSFSANGSNTDKISTVFQDPTTADADSNKVISWKESIPLGLALALNGMTSGFGAGISGVSPLWTTLSIGIFSLLSVELGVRLGYKIGHSWLGRYSNFMAGMLLVVIGFYEIFV